MEVMSFFVFLVVMIVLSVAAWQWWYDPKRVSKRRLRELSRSDIADVADGQQVKISGTLRYVGTPLEAPLSGRPCAYYEARVEENTGKNNWTTRIRDTAGGQFLIDDGTGKAWVKLDDPQSAIVEDVSFDSGLLSDPSVRAQRFLDEHGQDGTTFLGFNRTLRYSEGVLEEGERVAVYGLARWEVDPDPDQTAADYRGRAKRLRVEAPADGALVVSDDPDVT